MKIISGLLGLGLGLSLVMMSGARADGGRVYYRYLNEDGVKVLNHQIPPAYAQKGYEILSAGKVVKVVPPALSPEDAALQETRELRAEELAQWDEELRRRYSSVRDIEAIKQRKLAQLKGSIAILDSNVRGLKRQITQQHARAADSERMGQAVSKAVLGTLAALEEELKVTAEQIEQRQIQLEDIVAKYERDKDRFRLIRPE